MKKNNFQKLNGKDLDKLLNQAFLENMEEAGNDAMLESISNRVLVKHTPGVLVSTELFFTKFFFVISVLSFTGSLFTFLSTNYLDTRHKPIARAEAFTTLSPDLKPEVIRQNKINNHEEIPVKTLMVRKAQQTEQKDPQTKSLNTESEIRTVALSVDTQSLITNDGSMIEKAPDKQPEKDLPSTPKKEEIIPDRYLFPKLTQKQIKDNENEKKWMAKTAAKLKQDKSVEKYARIPGSPDKTTSEFYMASGEITNLDYRTFLFDLLLDDKKEEFLIAKPLQNLWLNAAGVNIFDTLSTIYFSDQMYDDYPVVNVSVAGAELYCAWLEELTNKIREKEGKRPVKIRLPYETEWLYAANVGRSTAVYPWFTDSIQDGKNRFLANFCIKKMTEKFKQPVYYPNGFNAEAYTAAGMATNHLKTACIQTWSYNANDFQLYNMCGNVSEMVYTVSGNIKTKGGNWNSDFEHLKLNSEDEFKDGVKPSPMIGFRVCITEQR